MHRAFISYHHGGDATYKDSLLALLNFRYLFETGAQTTTQGDMLTVTAIFPLGM